MDLDKDWTLIRQVFEAGTKSSKHCSIGSVGKDGRPHITPIGFVFLREDKTAFYFEQYTKRLPANYEHNRSVCLMAVNSGLSFWVKSLYQGQFLSFPGIRLYGEVGELRNANSTELARLKSRIGPASYLKGSKLIWSGLTTVRDIKLDSAEAVRYPRMMEHLAGYL